VTCHRSRNQKQVRDCRFVSATCRKPRSFCCWAGVTATRQHRDNGRSIAQGSAGDGPQSNGPKVAARWDYRLSRPSASSNSRRRTSAPIRQDRWRVLRSHHKSGSNQFTAHCSSTAQRPIRRARLISPTTPVSRQNEFGRRRRSGHRSQVQRRNRTSLLRLRRFPLRAGTTNSCSSADPASAARCLRPRKGGRALPSTTRRPRAPTERELHARPVPGKNPLNRFSKVSSAMRNCWQANNGQPPALHASRTLFDRNVVTIRATRRLRQQRVAWFFLLSNGAQHRRGLARRRDEPGLNQHAQRAGPASITITDQRHTLNNFRVGYTREPPLGPTTSDQGLLQKTGLTASILPATSCPVQFSTPTRTER